jgi:hypothetical protein
MAHFAKIDENNIVVNVLVVDDSQEDRGQEFLADDLGLGGIWIQTSYNATIRKKFAGIGDVYDESDDTFKPEKAFSSWIWNDVIWEYEPPVKYPEDGKVYVWDEPLISWIEFQV